jgi:hypothetical protein
VSEMSRWSIRDVIGAGSFVAGVVLLFRAIAFFTEHDPLAAVVLTVSGLALVGAGVELMRPTLGE